MTTKDLMIGDYVTFKDCQNDDAPAIVKIEGLGYQGRGVVEEALVTIDDDEYGFDLVEIDDEFVGIPLTPEILEKNGLVFDGTQTWRLNEKKLDIMVVPVQPDNEFWDEFSTRIEVCTNKSDLLIEAVRQIYVHQLQQMLRIAGSDKEIVL